MRLTRSLQRMTMAPLMMRCLMVARMHVSSVMFYLSSWDTLRLVCKSTCFPSSSMTVRSPTLFFAIVVTMYVPRNPQDVITRQRVVTWIASRGPARWAAPWGLKATHGGRLGGRGRGRTARLPMTLPVSESRS
ncbi:hypothetical protein PR202_ga25627 [Eleusine coracana subsp. coracana]|uniref:Secreted protein n=1 Tax=Eleusine coracana subsp. coracana TaxID=191504 RepID=A0AAV5DCF2_ELECO|nr:hypothetical protein PR202_ga25627 [Eleusine coracana subsp. coracana]